MISNVQQLFRTVLLRSPGSSFLIVLILGLGIGTSTTLFSVLDSILWRPLPFDQPEQLIAVLEGEKGVNNPTSPASFLALRESTSSLTDLTATHAWNPVLRNGEAPSEVRGLRTTSGLFELLRRNAEVGRSLSSSDDVGDSLAVISRNLWQRRFGGQPDVVGSTVSLDGEPFTVVGIMPADFAFPTFWATDVELWASLEFAADADQDTARFLRVFGRIDDGFSLEEARLETDLLAERLVEEDPEGQEGLRLRVTPLKEPTVGHVRSAFLLLFGMAGLLLVITCANIANLFLARTAQRRSEFAVRLALGASKRRLALRLLAESLVLALLGGATGILTSSWAIDALVVFGPEQIPRLAEISLDQRSLAFALCLSIATALMFGSAPIVGFRSWGINTALRTTAGLHPSDRLRRTLVTAQVAVTVVVLVGAGLLLRSFQYLSHFDPGFDRQNILTLQMSLSGTRHESPSTQAPFYAAAREAVEAVPGIASASIVNHLPVADDIWSFSVDLVGVVPPESTPKAAIRVANREFFETLGIEIIAGAPFRDAIGDSGRREAMVNETFVARYLQGSDPVGRQFRLGNEQPQEAPWTIVGVIGDIRQWRLSDSVRPEMIFPYSQNPIAFWPRASLVVRTEVEPTSVSAAVQSVLWELEPELAISNSRSMEAVLGHSIGESRLQALTVGFFAVFTAILSIFGIYGVISCLVSWRRTDIGMRMALGADRGMILRWVVAEGLKLATLGVGIGLSLAWLGRSIVSRLIYGIESHDLMTFSIAGLGLLVCAAISALIPAYSASRYDPLTCLRSS